MRILILANIPFDGMRRRQQQVALGLAAHAHDVLYLEPPRPFRSLYDPARFEPREITLKDSDDTAADDPGDTAADGPRDTDADRPGDRHQRTRVRGIEIRSVNERLRIARKGVALAKMGQWGWATRAGWKIWAGQVRRMLPALVGAGNGAVASLDGTDEAAPFPPDVTLVYHPALIPPARAALETPLVFECLDDFPSLAPSTSIAAAFEEALQRGLPRVDGLIAVNRYLAESWGRLLTPGAPCEVIEHGVDLSLFRPPDSSSRERARRALGIGDDRKVAGYLGRFDARISFEDLQAMLEIESSLQLLLLGEVSSEGQAILQRLPAGRFKCVGPLRQEQAAVLLAAADLLVFPFRREPHLESIRGLKLHEYLATGLPVVASFRRGVKAMREIIYLYAGREELESAVKAALCEPEKGSVRDSRIEAAREASWEKRAAAVGEFLAKVVGKVPGGTPGRCVEE